MDAVLGLSVTPTSIGLVLVEGRDADEVTVDRAAFGVEDPSDAVHTSERAAAAVLRTEARAADRGARLQSIGVTWSDDARTEASLLLKSLRDSGFDNIVPVRLSEATDALARRIASVVGYRTTAVCVIEPDHLIAMVVDSGAGSEPAVQTAVNHSVVTEEDLIGWLHSVFTLADWAPEALVLVGSAEDLDGLAPILEEALAVPVFTPDEAWLALARGAALACAQPVDAGIWAAPDAPAAATSGRQRLARVGPATLLAAGAVTFVVSMSVAVAMHLAPDEPALTSRATRPAPVVAEVAARPIEPPAPPAPPAPVVPIVDPVPAEVLIDPVPEALPEALPEAAPIAEAAAPAAPPPLPVEAIPAAVPAPPVPEERPGILQRIRDRINGLGNDAAPPPPAPVTPPPVPPVYPPPVPPVFPAP